MKRILIILLLSSRVLLVSSQTRYVSNDAGDNIVSDSSGIYSGGQGFEADLLFPKDNWSGEWIWLNKTDFSEYQTTQIEWRKNPAYKRQYKALFRKTFGLKEVPDEVFVSLTADVAFRLYVNGTFVTQGPPDTGCDYFDGVPPKHWFFTSHRIEKFLKQGTNVIAVEVFSHYREISETSSGQGLLICDLDDGFQRNIVATDTSWKCNVDTSFLAEGGKFRVFADFEIPGWKTSMYNDSAWNHCSVIEMPTNGYLMQSRMQVPFRYPVQPHRLWLPGEETAYNNVTSTVCNQTITNREFTLDYNRNITAYYGFEVLAHKNDTVKIYPSEKRNGSLNRSLVFVCREGINVFNAPYLSVFRYLTVEIKSPKGLIINDINNDFSSYPLSHTGSFSCSDSNLTQLWEFTRWTTRLCMNDMFYDSPKHQEPIACTGDYLIESLISYYAFGDGWLTRQTLIKTALMLEKNNYDMFHTSYSLLWVQMLRQYYRFTGDIQLLHELMPHVNKLNQLFETYLDSDFLVSNAPDYMFMDWIKIGDFNAHHPPAVIGMGYMTAFFYKSLTDAAEMNRLIQNYPVGEKNQELAGKIKSAMNGLLWDSKRGLYRDGIPFRSKRVNHFFFPPDTAIVTYSPHMNTLAVLYDIAPASQRSALLNYIVNQEETALQPYFMFYVLSAVKHAGEFNTLGLRLMKKWENGICAETHTLKENWQEVTDTGYGGDYSHAWGGSPLIFLSACVLGVNAGMDGHQEIEITPFIHEDVWWAKGTVPLKEGFTARVHWKRLDSHSYWYKLEIPEGFSTSMLMPVELISGGYSVNGTAFPSEQKRIWLGSGEYSIEFREE